MSSPRPVYNFWMKRNDYKQNKKRGASEVGSSTKLPPVNPKQAVQANLSLNAASQQEEGLISILHEYFMKNHYHETLEAFQRDCCRQVKVKPSSQEDLKKELLAHFDQGQREPFFIKFAQFVPISMRSRDPQTMRIEFYLQLYFFIFALHPFLGKKKSTDAQAKQAFIGYLEGRGANLSKSPEFLQYYALTNLQKPQEHPVFKSLFTREWVAEFRKRIAFFLEKLYPAGKVPALTVIYDRFIEGLERQSNAFPTEPDEEFQILQEIEEEANELNPEPVLLESAGNVGKQAVGRQATFKVEKNKEEGEGQVQLLRATIEQLQEQKDALFQHLQGEKSKSQHWQNIYREFSQAAQNIIMESQTKWFQITQQIYSITDEILTVCKKMQEGVPLAEPDLIDKIALKLGKYERFMKMKIQEIIEGENFDFSVFTPAGEDDSVMLNRVGKGTSKLIQLDFAKIHACLAQKEVLGGGEVANQAVWEAKILLLQALKWRVNKARSALAKREAVLSYTAYDLLGLRDPTDDTLATLLSSENEYVVLETVGLIGSLTKDYYGREYLVCQKLYKPIIGLFSSFGGSEQVKEQALYGLQICSTKKLAQELMIRFDMIHIIVKKIERQRETLPAHYLEYLVALLINILLHKEGPKKAEEIKGDIMMTLINLIQCENMSIRSLIHGSLYPLLCHRAFREKAKEFGLLENIKFLLQNNKSEQHENQLIYLKEKLQKDFDQPAQEKDDSDDNNDQDEFFSEEYRDEIEEYAQININGIKGEELLMKQYVLLGPDALSQRNLIQDKVSQTLKRKDILMDNSFYERESVNTPLLNNKLRRNISNNNSVYSSKSTNRVLKSEMNSRSQINSTHNLPNPIANKEKIMREKLDTVHQNNSEVSIKEYQQKIIEPGLQDTFRRPTEEPLINASLVVNESQKQPEVKTYENTEEYKNIFQTRAKLVRTPPRK